MRENVDSFLSEIMGLYLIVHPKFNHFMLFCDIFL